MNYRQLTESVRSRLNPEGMTFEKSYYDELATISYSDVLVFIRTAMNAVDQAYTQKSLEAGEKVKEHLNNGLTNVEFRYQGSVMTDTHIRGYSDIDLLTICHKFYSYDSQQLSQIINSENLRVNYSSVALEKLEREFNSPAYQGDILEDLLSLRLNSEKILFHAYMNCDVGKPKSIKIKNLHLKRDVDIVIASWYDDVMSIINGKGDYRGIQIYNKATNSRENPDFPFLSIRRVNDKSARTNGRLKRMIRFLKHVKANSDRKIDLTSFDINAICYDIEETKYSNKSYYDLVSVIYLQIRSICNDQTYANRIVSVDGREYIFRGNDAKLENLRALLGEVESIYLDLTQTSLR